MRIAKIKPNDIVNGEGIVVSVFVQGCPHHCKGCFNKETWNFEGGEPFTDKDEEEVLKLLDADNINRNLSVLGGEPLCPENIDGVLSLCKYIKENRPKTKIYVWSGYLFEDLIDKYGSNIFENIDVLIDGQFQEDKKNLMLKLRGSSNQKIINISEKISF